MPPKRRGRKPAPKVLVASTPPQSQPADNDATYANMDDPKENRPAEQMNDTIESSMQADSKGRGAVLDQEDEGVDDFEAVDEPATMQSTPQAQKASYAATGGYNALKSFNGQVYSGMAVGGSHTWNYDPGVWRETKEEPDLWKIDYKTKKKRAKAAPTGSGAPVGTEYHWLIVAHQYVRKIDANTYETHLEGSKYKLAHKNASSNSWSIPTVKAQRDHEVELLDDAKRRVQGLPPVLATEKVKVEKAEKGQRKLDSLFSKSPAKSPMKNNVSNEDESPARKRTRLA